MDAVFERGAKARRATPAGGPSPFHRPLESRFHRLQRGRYRARACAQAAALLCCLGRVANAQTAPPPAQLADGFVYAGGESGEVGCLPAATVATPLLTATTRALDAAGLDPDFAVLLTAQVLTCPSIFYSSVENDIEGIGYQRERQPALFDDAPDRRLQGIAFLNDLPYWEDNPAEFELAFLHELGHRWLARVHATLADEEVALTGRDGDHWSYFLDTGGSPLEGNVWSDGDQDGTFVANTPAFPVRYSALDLYLMGAASADEVGPLRLFRPDVSANDAQLDCSGRPVAPASPPQACGPLTFSGAWQPLSIDDVIQAEGPRLPSVEEAPKRFSVAFVLLDPGDAGFDADGCQRVGAWAEHLTALFSDATDGRLTLENAALGGKSCAELELAKGRAAGGGCALAPARASAPRLPWGLLAAAGLLAFCRRPSRRRTQSGRARS